MFRLVFLIIFILFGYNKTHPQLNQQSKKITKTFFEDFSELEDNTPALKKKKGFTNQKELNQFIEELKKNFPNLVELDYIGQTQKGKKIPIVYLRDKSFKDSKKIRMWMQGGSHGNEPASTETLLFLIHELLHNLENRYLLEKIRFAFVPMLNIDGYLKNDRYSNNGLDLNRDHTKLMSPEIIASVQAFSKFDPHIALDFHEYRPFRKDFAQLSTFGISSIYDFMFLHSGNLNVSENIRVVNDTLFVANAKKSLDEFGFRHRHYMKSEKFKGEINFSTGSNTARSSSNYYALNNAFATLFEIRGVGIGKTSFKRRIKSGLTVGFSYIKTAYKNYDFILNQIELANNFSSEIIVDHVRTSSKEFIDAIDIETNSKIAMEVVMHSSKKSKAKRKIDRPKAYIIKKNQTEIIEKLDINGIKTVKIENDTTFLAGSYTVTAFKDDFKIYEKMKMQDVDVRIDYSDIQFSKGDLILPMKQKKSNLIAELMEPEAPNSYVSFGLIKTGINKILPIYRIREL